MLIKKKKGKRIKADLKHSTHRNIFPKNNISWIQYQVKSVIILLFLDLFLFVECGWEPLQK